MGTLKLSLKRDDLPVPLEAESISPDILSKLALADIGRLPVFLGKRECRLEEFFDIEGEPSEDLVLSGDLSRVKWIGKGMSSGHIVVSGNAGMHLGAYMSGGSIEVTGNVTDWLGAEMTGGHIRVHGNAGGQAGAAYRGSPYGMQDGVILIEGSAANEVGMRMKSGIIAIRGAARDFTGLQMKGGSIFLFGGAGIRTGAWMERGTIVASQAVTLLPTFLYACRYQPGFLRLYFTRIRELGFEVPERLWKDTVYSRYSGDSAVPGKGEILVSQPV